MRIVHALVPAAVGGLERVVQMLSLSQVEAGYDVTVAAIGSALGSPNGFLDGLDGRVTALPVEVPDRAWLREIRRLTELLRSTGPDILHTHGYRPDVIAGAAANRAGVARVSTAHGFTGGGWKNRLYERLQVAAYRRRGQVVAVSLPLHDRLAERGVPRARLHMVRNAWRPAGPFLSRRSARNELGLPPDGTIVGFVGRLGHEKGPDVALEAIALVPDATLAFVGGGALEGELRSRAADLGVSDRVRLLGWVSDAARRLPAFDLLVLSSRTEGTPIILLEALAAGVPIVATRVGGVPDVIRDGAEGLLVSSEAPAALARAMQECLGDSEAAASRAAAGRTKVSAEFGVEAWVSRYDRVYQRATEEIAR